MTALAKIKEEFQGDHADQIAAIRSDVEQLRTDLGALRDDLLNNEAAVQRRKKRPGSEMWAQSLTLDELHGEDASHGYQNMRQRQLAGAAIASTLVIAAGAFAIWSSRHAASTG